ncbi:MAG TPA: NUDIX pyrophosphatase [Tepidiformaceae bacterium]
MARAPFNVLVIPFLRRKDAAPLFCVLRRADDGWWQWVAGGGEDNETSAETAKRETLEETGLAGPLYRLQAEARVPVTAFAAHLSWSESLYVIPEYAFAVEAPSPGIILSREHTELRWLPEEEASALLYWQTNQLALWELAERLERDDLPEAL